MASNEARAGAPGVLSQDDAFLAFYDATSIAAYSVALRVAGERLAAEAACEAAYLQVWRESRGAVAEQSKAELRLLEVVRTEALRRRTAVAGSQPSVSRASTPERMAVATALEKAPALGRRAVELAYFGGLSVPEIAVMLESSVAELRQAMRETMLSVASATKAGGKR